MLCCDNTAAVCGVAVHQFMAADAGARDGDNVTQSVPYTDSHFSQSPTTTLDTPG